MKNIILLTMVTVLLFASCKKDHEANNKVNTSNTKKYPVTFAVSQFEQQGESIYHGIGYICVCSGYI
jgi:hypothetical protein